MSFLATIDAEAASRQLRYLVIGGLAINHYGFSRDTSDLDLLISQNERVEWMKALAMLRQRIDAELYGVKTGVPSLEHLIALKIHALKNTQAHRFLKDFLDVENLIRINQLDIKSQKVRDLFDKYGTQDLYEKKSRSFAQS